MHSPQFLVNEVLPAMQALLAPSAVMAEAAASEPNVSHFDASSPSATTPLIADVAIAMTNAPKPVAMTFD